MKQLRCLAFHKGISLNHKQVSDLQANRHNDPSNNLNLYFD